jgi:hypothetical protein
MVLFGIGFGENSTGTLRAQVNTYTAMLTPEPAAGCCFALSYTHPGEQRLMRLEVALDNTDARFSAVQYSLTSDWRLTTLVRGRQLRWTYRSGQLPGGEQEVFNFCLEDWNTRDSVNLLVHWYAGNTRTKTDTLRMGCTDCWQPEADSLFCNPDRSYTYRFNFRNDSGFTVDFLSLYEPDGQDLITQETIPLGAPLAPGGVTPPITLAIDAAAVAEGELCFGLTPRRYLQDTIAVDCCSATYCFPLPPCDTCCTAYTDYQDDVNAGFMIMGNCETRTLTLMANALNDCDRVRYSVTGLGGGVVDGNETFQIGGLVDEQTYRVCMRVSRQNLAGEACYELPDLEICQAYFFDCDFCFEENNIDLENECPAREDAVCGCDGLTYLNACTAFNWGGLNFWAEGHCDSLNSCEILLTVTDTLPGAVEVAWTNTRPDPLRYYLVQRRLPPDGPWFTLAQLPATASDYLDLMPLSPAGEYRVLAVTETGALIYGEQDPDCIKGTTTVQVLAGGRVWPNPTRDWLEVELPVARIVQLQVYSALGQRLDQVWTDHYGRVRLPTSHLPAGTYWIVLRLGAGQVWRQAFVRQP